MLKKYYKDLIVLILVVQMLLKDIEKGIETTGDMIGLILLGVFVSLYASNVLNDRKKDRVKQKRAIIKFQNTSGYRLKIGGNSINDGETLEIHEDVPVTRNPMTYVDFSSLPKGETLTMKEICENHGYILAELSCMKESPLFRGVTWSIKIV